jgi:hypothetical protein
LAAEMEDVVSVIPNHIMCYLQAFDAVIQGKLGAPVEGNVVIGLLTQVYVLILFVSLWLKLKIMCQLQAFDDFTM